MTASEKGRARAYARKHAFDAGAPLSFDVEHPHVTALEYLLGALGVDLAVGLQLVARRQRVEIDDLEVLIQGSIGNPMVFLRVVGEEGHPGVDEIQAKVYISSFAEEALVARVWQEALEISPVVNTLRKSVNLLLTYQQVL